MRILVTGATGLIGKKLIRQALRQGHDIIALVRRPESFKMIASSNVYKWDHHHGVPQNALSGVDAIIHLAGENIADKPWSESRRKSLVESRIAGTSKIIEALSSIPAEKRPKVLVSGSAIGFYGYSRDGIMNEKSKPAHDFLANLCIDWETEAKKAEPLGLRVVLARTGIVLSKEGGALPKMPPVRISDGKAWMSWIHVDDMVNGLLFAATESMLTGPVNFVAPNPVQNGEFVKQLAAFKKVPAIGFVPKFVLKTVLGELAEVVTSSLRVSPTVLQSRGFKFAYTDLHEALAEEFKNFEPLDQFVTLDQFVPLPPEKIFPFFQKAENLETLTPPWLNFKIVSQSTREITTGTEIIYKLSIHGVPVKWKTLIKDFNPQTSFIDEQIKGPYSKWHHLHAFEKVPGGCLLRDQITYRVPVSIIGHVLLGSWIANDVNQIFSYRQTRIEELLKAGELQ